MRHAERILAVLSQSVRRESDVELRPPDPIPGQFTIQAPNDCPAFDLEAPSGSNGAHLEAVVELFMTVNGIELRPSGVYRVRDANYKSLYAPCVR